MSWPRLRTLVMMAGAVLVSAVSLTPAAAAPRQLDPTFGAGGKITTDIGHHDDLVFSIGIDPDGRIVAGGEAGIGGRNPTFVLARYDPDGSLDDTFGTNGIARTDPTGREDVIYGVAIQNDGKIVVVGVAAQDTRHPRFVVARYDTGGHLDATFGDDGTVITDFGRGAELGFALTIEPGGTILAAGDARLIGSRGRWGIARYNIDGSLDATFGGDGTVTTNFTRYPEDALAVAVEADGKILVAGGDGFGAPDENFALARYDADGSLDPSFDGDGKLTTTFGPRPDVAFGLGFEPDGGIVVAGQSSLGPTNPKFALARYEADGTLDPTFGGDAKVQTDFTPHDDGAFGVGIQNDGRIVAAGVAGNDGGDPRFALARYDTDGTLDTTFDGDGTVTTNFTDAFDSAFSVAIESDGNIVAGGPAGAGTGNAMFALARYRAT